MKRAIRIGLTIAMIPVVVNIGYRIGWSDWFQEFATRFEPSDTIRIVLYLFLAYYSSILLHELGHLGMGLATGYRFLSIRILSLSLEKQRSGKLRWKRRPVWGMLGQCFMVPNETKKPSHFWYNFGGVFFNLLQIGLSWVGLHRSATIKDGLWWFSMIVMGSLFVGFNWLPLRHSHNDGNNYREIKRDSLSREAFDCTLRISRDIADDARLSELKIELEYGQLSYDKPIQAWLKSMHVIKALFEYRFADYLVMTDEAEAYYLNRRDPRAHEMKAHFYLARLFRHGSSAVITKDAMTIKLLKILKWDPFVQMVAYYEALLIDHPKKEKRRARFHRACLKAPYQGEAKDIQDLALLLEGSVSNFQSLVKEAADGVELSLLR